jgi:transposase InsO family protein
VNLFNHLLCVSRYLNRYQLIKESSYSKSQLYQWLKQGVGERKVRECQTVSEGVVKAAVEVIRKYPHFGAPKGQCYMLYHQKGYIPQHIYKTVKKIVKRLVFQEVSNRRLLPARTSYEHERPEKPGEIWAQDFTEIRVCGEKFYVALVIDVAMTYYLGARASIRPNDEMVQAPVDQALELSGGQGPKRFLLSDNGPQYVSTRHGDFLDKLDIIQKRIPACKPEYNGSIECGIKEFKNVFYNVWAKVEENDVKDPEEDEPLVCVQLAVNETIRRMNEEIPRPALKGVTPADVLKGIARERREINRKYLEREQESKEVIEPWNRKDWGYVKKHLFKENISNLELMTKFCFYLKRPLRKLAKLGMEVLGN